MTAFEGFARTEHPNVYRSDIDGLRAVAVALVLIYHAGLGFSGGYIGVDVFFVISGFLITQILKREVELDNFSIIRFYERRLRRILPALLVTLIGTMIAGAVFHFPVIFTDLGKTVLSTLAFVSNVKFWRGNGYFGTPEEYQPLLHTWSLAIEEQFYIAWPLLIVLLIGGHRQRWGIPLIWIGLFSSLGLSAVGAFLAPAATFLLLPTRGWELMVGAVLALDLVPRFKMKTARIAGCAGILAIMIPAFVYTEVMPFPGLSALPPCIGTALLIQAGRSGNHWIGSLLSWRPLVAIGLISYSLYLIHLPVLAFLRLAWSEELPPVLAVLALVASGMLAVLSWRYVEQPFRNRAAFPATRIWRWSLAGSALTAGLAVAIILSNGLPQRFSPRALTLAESTEDFDATARSCIGVPVETASTLKQCRFGPAGRTDIVLWGDSHAAALLPAFVDASGRTGLGGYLISTGACPPLLHYAPPSMPWKDRRSCLARQKTALDILAKTPPSTTIVITAFWPTYRTALEGAAGAELLWKVRASLERLRDHRVVILLDTPSASQSLPLAAALDVHLGRETPDLDAHRADPIEAMLSRAAPGIANVFRTTDAVCQTDGRCRPLYRERPLLSDPNHIAASAARDAVGPWLAQVVFKDDSPSNKL